MPVAATSREAKISEALVNMVGTCAIAQSLTGAANLTACKAFIVEDYAGDRGTFKAVDGTTLNPLLTFFVVRLGEVTAEKRARDTYGWTATATIMINQAVTPGDTPAEQFRRIRNAQGDLAAQLTAQFGSVSPFVAHVAGEINPREIILADDVTPNRLHLVATIDCTLFDLP